MSLNWNWSNKIGEVKYTHGRVDNLYNGNAQLIAIHEHDDEYWLAWFSSNRNHLRNMLGLEKGYDSCLDSENRLFDIEEITLYDTCRDIPKIVTDLLKAKVNIKIQIIPAPTPW